MRHLLALTVLVGIGAGLASTANAMPAAAGAPRIGNAQLDLVAEGCGRGFSRDAYGRCRRLGPPPPRYRACPPGLHMTRYGCRRNY